MKNITCIILAGGFGSRLKSVVSDRPKVLAEVNGRPFIFYLLEQIKDAGISRVVLSTGYLAEMVTEVCGNRYKGVNLQYSVEEAPLGTGGAVIKALEQIETEYILVMNGDSYCDVSLVDFINSLKNKPVEAGMVVTELDNAGRYGSVVIGEPGYISEFNEKQNKPLKGFINAGIYIFRQDFFSGFPAGVNISLERDVFPGKKNLIQAYRHKGIFIDIGTPESYKKCKKIF